MGQLIPPLQDYSFQKTVRRYKPNAPKGFSWKQAINWIGWILFASLITRLFWD